MRLYLSKGRVWTGTQADAKAAQGGAATYETVEVPDAKPERMKWLNEQWAKLLGDKVPEPAPVAPAAPVSAHPEAPEGMEWRLAPVGQFGPPGSFRSKHVPGKDECLACTRTRKGAQVMGEIMAKDDVLDALYAITDDRHLDEIAALLSERRAALTREAMLEREGIIAAMQPVARVRQRVRVPAPEGVTA